MSECGEGGCTVRVGGCRCGVGCGERVWTEMHGHSPTQSSHPPVLTPGLFQTMSGSFLPLKNSDSAVGGKCGSLKSSLCSGVLRR